ncbi:MAG: amidohydrolase family protein [Pseudomonadota bacterium]
MLSKVFLRTVVCTGVALVTVLLTLPTPDANPEPEALPVEGRYAFTNINVFDGEQMRRNQTVVVDEARIQAIGPGIEIPVQATVIDGTGKTLLPGLIDAHVHTYGQALREAPRFGVTTVLDMFTDPATLTDMRSDRDSLEPSDRAALFSAGMLATVTSGHGTQYGIEIDTLDGPDEAESWVDARALEGSDYIKLVYDPYRGMPSLDLATAKAVIDAAHGRKLLAVAHVSDYRAAEDMIDAGIDGLVHIFIDRAADDALVAKAKDAGVFIIPTLTVIGVVNGDAPGAHWLEDERLGSLLSGAQRALLTQSFGQFPGIRATEHALASVRAFHTAGVPILAGTDAPNPGTAHGISQHDELELLVRAGLSPTEALRAATSLPAETFFIHDRGRIESGARADLVLVEGDPSENILATRNIVEVYRNGRALNRTPDVMSVGNRATFPADLGDFEDASVRVGDLLWTTTTDAMMGGASEAELTLISSGADGSNSAIEVVASNNAGFPYPWAGFFLDASSLGPADMTPYTHMSFAVRGTPARYRLMLFTADSYGVPPTIEFPVAEEWTSVSLALSDAGEFDATQVIGFAIVTPLETGAYTFAVDNVQLVP